MGVSRREKEGTLALKELERPRTNGKWDGNIRKGQREKGRAMKMKTHMCECV